MAVEWTEQIQNHKMLICSDSGLSAINSVGKGSSKSRQDLVYDILLAIRDVKRRGVEISSLWVPAHVGIATNEKVDKLAKEAALKETIDVNINLSKAHGKSIVWQETSLKWQQLWEQEDFTTLHSNAQATHTYHYMTYHLNLTTVIKNASFSLYLAPSNPLSSILLSIGYHLIFIC